MSDQIPLSMPAARRAQRWRQQEDTADGGGGGGALVDTHSNRSDTSRSDKRSSSSKSKSNSNKKSSSSKKKKSRKGGDDDDGKKKEEGEEDKPDADELLEEALLEQRALLIDPTETALNRVAPEWATHLSDLTLLHELELNRDAQYVSQGVLDELNRDVNAAAALNNDVLQLDTIAIQPQPLDVEEAARACPPPASQNPPELSQRLLANLTSAREAYINERPIGITARLGEDGIESTALPEAAEMMRIASLQRAIVQDEFPCYGSSTEGQHPAIASASGLHLRGFRSVPKVHAEFIVDALDSKGDDAVLMDAGSARMLHADEELLRGGLGARFASALRASASSSSSSATDGTYGEDVEAKRVITINLGSIRFRDHPFCTREHSFAHHLLDAYTQYKMLSSNLLQGLKSRHHYDVIVQQLDRSLMRKQRYSSMNQSSSSQHHHHHRSSTGGTAAGVPAEEQQLSEQLSMAKSKLGMAVEMETRTLTAMWTAWKELCDLWRASAAVAGGAIDGGYDEEGNPLPMMTQQQQQQQHQQRMMMAPQVRMSFSLTRRDDPEQTPYSEAEGQNILDFVPNVVVEDPPPLTTAMQQSKKSGSKKDDGSATDAGGIMAGAGGGLPAGSDDNIFILKVFVKTSEAAGVTLVGTTHAKPLDTVFGASFNETFELHVTRDPLAIFIRLCSYPSERVVAEVAIPPSLTHAAHELVFTTGEKFVDASDSMFRDVGGVIVASTTWTTNTGLTVESIERLFLNGEADPLDPRNAHLVASLRRHYQLRNAQIRSAQARPMVSLLGGGGNMVGSSFRASSSASASSDPNALTLERVIPGPPDMLDRRLQLLNLRWGIVTGKEVPKDAFQKRIALQPMPANSDGAVVLEREIRAEVDSEEIDILHTKKAATAGASDPKDSRKAWLVKLREKKLAKKPQPLTDDTRMARLITLPPIPTPGAIIAKLFSFLQPHSGLNPPREMRATIEEADRTNLQEKWGNSTITTHVMKASNLPIRDDGSPIHAFIELRFVDKAVCTLAQPGADPSWFETLAVPFEPEDFNDDSLSFIDDDIVLSVYDEVHVPLPTTATTNPTSQVTHFRIERRFLGAVKIPFYTLYHSKNASIEASFRVFQPRTAMGYQLSNSMPTLNLYVSLWPPLSKIEVPAISFIELQENVLSTPASAIYRQLKAKALEWTGACEAAIAQVTTLQPKAEGRDVRPFAPASSRDLQLLCRFLRKEGIPLPPGVTTVAEAIRFVALFPFEVDMMTAAEDDEWSTIPEFLQMGVGDYEEIAILLVMLLRSVTDAPVFLCAGVGDVYPQAVYVLMYYGNSWKLIDPRTGDVFETSDPMTGLSEVSMVISHNQIWGNIQLSGMPYRMMWDLDDSRYWMPMFDAEHRTMMMSVESLQPPAVQWAALPTPDEVVALEDDVRRSVKASLRQLRNDRDLVFNERVAVTMRDVLVCMEDERRINASTAHPVVAESMAKAIGEFGLEYAAVGSPVNRSVRRDPSQPLSLQLCSLLDGVRETAVHEVGAQSTKFAVAVHVRPYATGLFSIWVYAIALVQRL